MPNKYKIASDAMELIGANPISDFAGGTRESRVAGNLYDDHVNGLLAAKPWGFATRMVDLGSPLANYPEADSMWDRAYLIPATSNMWIRTVKLNGRVIDYERFEDRIYCNAGESDTVALVATFRVDEGKFPPWFLMALKYDLASLFAGPITKKAEMVNEWGQKAAAAWATARAADSAEATTKKVTTSRFITQRR